MTHSEPGRNHASDPPIAAFPVVGIGASAGGLAALEEFFRALPPAPGMAFVVVQHLSPDHASEIAKLLQQQTPLPVREAEDGVRVQADHVYTIPPGRQLVLREGCLRLSAAEGRDGHVQAPIDMFFRSLGEELGEAAACVVLSGTGRDGTVGLKAVKEAGGLALVQSPDDAEYDGMPRSAVDTGLADLTGTAQALARRLVELRDEDGGFLPLPGGAAEGERSADLSRLFALLRARTGHDFSHYKRSSVLRRASRRLQVLRIPDLPSYTAYAREHPQELESLLKDLLISVTGFFRDPDAWRALEERVVPRLFEGKSGGDLLRVWVPGCASGEEAYSLGILLCEHASTLDDPPQLQIFATDIDEGALAFAREGLYPESVAEALSAERRRRFFDAGPAGLRVRRSVREQVLFAPHNLLSDPPFSRLDLVSCRNLLIYLNREVQESVFALFHYALRPEGYLFLGASESAEGHERLFAPADRPHRLYRRLGTRSRVPTFPTVAAAPGRDRGEGGPAKERSAAERHRDWLIRTRVPPSLLVGADYQIFHSAGGAHRFLREVDGVPGHDLLEKIHPELRLDLRAALFRAFQAGEPTRTRAVPVDLAGESRRVTMEVVALDESEFPGRFAEIVFEVEPPGSATAEAESLPADTAIARQLEEELTRTQERLQSLLEEYETSNEELQASNEELQSMNEELRSTSEELQSGKEELQSMNEELITLNSELRAKIEELARANGDLNNLMEATEIGTIFLDRQLCIARYTPRAEDLFHLRPGDVGRPLRALSPKLRPHDLVELAQEVLRTRTPAEREQLSEAGRWFITRVQPYRSVEDAVEGVVLTFVDVTELKEAERRARFQADVLRQVQDAVVVVDGVGRIGYLNPAAGERLGLEPGRAMDRNLGEALEFASAPDRAAAEAALAGEGEWHGEVLRRVGEDGPHRLEASLTALVGERGERIGTLGVFRDVTARREAERLAHERQQYLRTALRNLPIVASIMDLDLRYRWIYNPHPDFDASAVLGRRDDELLEGDEAREITALKREVLERRESVRRELAFARSDGVHVYDMTVDPLYDDRGELVGLTAAGLDVSERKLHEQALEAAKREAEGANAAKSAFLAAMSHELRTPLNAVMGYVDLLELGVPDPITEAQRRHVYRIRMSARHLLQLIEEILQFARLDAGREEVEPVDVPIADLLEEVGAIIQPLARQKELELRLDAGGAPERVRTDPRKLRQILLNLLGNAVKFTEEGRVELRIAEDEGRTRFHVIDTGSGISEEEVAQIFQPFWQGDSSLTREAGGTGLGLAICLRYVELLGGTIRVTSEPGSGSAFTVEIPA